MTPAAFPTLIADDEPLGRDLVRTMLAVHRDFRVVAECGDGERALAEIRQHQPSVVFLDVKMPRLDGMSVLQKLEPAHRPLVILVTAHDRFALKAFDAHVFDYLLKPFDQDRFDQTIVRIRRQLQQADDATLGRSVRRLLDPGTVTPLSATASSAIAASAGNERIVIRENGRVTLVAIADIEWLKAAGNYVELHVAQGRTQLVHDTLAALEARLDPRHFVRIHRSTIVRIDRIKELLPHLNGEYVVVLHDGTKLKLSRGFLESARRSLGLR